MRLFIVGLATMIFAVSVSDLIAQEADETPYWYVTQWQIAWPRVDSLISLEKQYSPQIREAVGPEETNLLDRKVLIHDTGTKWNVMIMNKYSSWSAIRDDPPVNVMERVFPGEEGEEISEAYGWVFEGATHYDAIYIEAEEQPD